MPQLTAIMDAADEAAKSGAPVIADGGIRASGDVAKALAGGAAAVMIGSLLAGTEGSAGRNLSLSGPCVQILSRDASVGAMARGSADRYFQQDIKDQLKLVPEGIEGQVAYKGHARDVIHQLVGGVKAAMGYTGAATIEDAAAGAVHPHHQCRACAKATSTTSRSPARRPTTRHADPARLHSRPLWPSLRGGS